MRNLLAAAVLAGVVAAAVALDAASPDTAGAAGLRPFSSCQEVEAWFEEAAERTVVAVGGGEVLARDALEEAAAPTAAAGDQAAGAGGGGNDGRDFSGTNLQEESVDEPDVVKTDGRLLVAASWGILHVVDARTAEELAAFDLPGEPAGDELLLRGDRALVLSRVWRAAPAEATRPASGGSDAVASDVIGPGEEVTRLTAVDLSDATAPRVVATAEIDGSYVSARMTGATVRVVLQQWAGMRDPAAAEGEAWLPSIAVDDRAPEPLASCEAVQHSSAAPQSPGTTSIVTFDAEGTLQPVDTEVVAASAATVYASPRRLYVASQSWSPRGPGATELHAFDASGADDTAYLGSGAVEGALLNQWSLSEAGGVLRVASTTETDSRITTLGERDGALVPLGVLTGLGPSERIYAVRYLGDVAYVVTFRQTDPLYTIDLSDPADPRTLGELKVTGFSSYLHPVGDGRMLGVGQEADLEGRTTGMAVSLFDVADLAAPALLDRLDVPGAHSPVEWDHKAFTWWAPTSTAVVPYDRHTERDAEAGAVVLAVSASEVSERGRLHHTGRPGVPGQWPPSISRSIVVGPTLWTLSEAGLLASDLSTLADRAWLDFPNPAMDEPVEVEARG